MTTKNLPAIAEIGRSLASSFNAAAPEDMRWRHERAFFEAQIKRDWKVARAVERRVPDTIESLKLAARECASMGLTMSPTAQLVYFIPRGKHKGSEIQIVTASPSYRGLSYIATHYANAEIVASEVVYADDRFRYLGPLTMPEHEPTLDNRKRNEQFAIGAYALVKFRTGTIRCEYVDAPTILRIRQLSEFPNALMWTTLWTEGWRKVAMRRISKTAMNSAPRMLAATDVMNRNEGIILPDHSQPPSERVTANGDDTPPARPRGMDGLGETLNGEYSVVDPPEEEPPPARYQAESQHPPGSIEYWCDQINGAASLEQLDDVKVAALEEHVDRDEEIADFFRSKWSARRKELRGAS